MRVRRELFERKSRRLSRSSKTLRAAAAKFREVRAQVSTARPLSALARTHQRPGVLRRTHASHNATTSTLVHLHLHLEQVPREIQHVSYSTAQISHDLNILHSKMAHSKSAGKLIAELPAVHALTAQLKEAKNGTTEARHLHDKIKVHLHSIGSQLLEGKVEHEQMANAVKRNADAIHARSRK